MKTFKECKEQLLLSIENTSSEDELHKVLNKYHSSINFNKSVTGQYIIKGTNQDREQTPYSGILEIKHNSEGRLRAVWVIGKDQLQFGTGFIHENTLVFNFYYEGEEDRKGKQFKGVVVYKILINGDLDGFWSEKYGDQDYIGKEYAKKVVGK